MAEIEIHKPRALGPTTTTPPTLDALQHGATVTLESLLTALYICRYNGTLTFDFHNGRPNRYAVGRPKRGNIIITA